jgi:hypothetical protein
MKRRTEAPLPGDAFGDVQTGQQVDLFREQVVVVVQVKSKQLEGFDECAVTSDDLGTAICITFFRRSCALIFWCVWGSGTSSPKL